MNDIENFRNAGMMSMEGLEKKYKSLLNSLESQLDARLLNGLMRKRCVYEIQYDILDYLDNLFSVETARNYTFRKQQNDVSKVQQIINNYEHRIVHSKTGQRLDSYD